MPDKTEKSMNACVLAEPDSVENKPLEYKKVAVPEPGSGELLIKIKACGVCRTDLHVVEGELPVRRSPVIPGHQIVGVVEKTGERVENFAKGERVGVAWLNRTCGKCRFCLSGRENLCESAEFTGWTRDGGFAEYVAAPADFVYHLPADFADFQAAQLCAPELSAIAL
jgi:propanol-preferring alcohol dehydrogenase